MKIGIIGFGQFGQFMAKYLSKKADVFVTDSSNKKKQANEIGVSFVDLNQVVKSEVVILAVPMQNLEETLHEIKDKLQPRTLVLDVCSLKVFATKLMDEILPNGVEIIATHPLFGPQSAQKSLKGMKIVLCNVRSSKINLVKEFCESLGLDVVITTSKKHDKEMAISQALTHFIGRIVKNIGIKRVELSTRTFDNLMDVVDMIKDDSDTLFEKK